ncbi:hypothetical protein BCT30_02730 [Enterovibrio norvegicus]|uniref:hypothetical protein n=1 Tax=Enterovibrio norvegicus TaxID=188144 RepID=UPI000C830B20|nr:hypothetical protein [Enterovibrio norvegicus]PMI32240.1 hypothetical protein BCU47_12675 [Enterovibrio norvegicus]PMI33137.1 hypothetical protein BCU46_03405 [Enterovibrio norvegicus]PMN48313.1 hypothetical protein BCT30_02730 [Enterovibrio norvegicus]
MQDTISFDDFLNNTPPYSSQQVMGIISLENIRIKNTNLKNLSKLMFSDNFSELCPIHKFRSYCDSEHCKSTKFFEITSDSELTVKHGRPYTKKLVYQCKNCEESEKTYFIRFFVNKLDDRDFVDNETPFIVEKIGEYPRFGKPIPAQALKLIGRERELFFKGSNCENLGMGIGAFSYYRRVIDAKKDKIFDAIIKVLKLTEGNQELIDELNAAKQETQFTKAVDKIKKAIPSSLNINGQNPLTLLYRALSEGLHVDTDEECLRYAQAIKIVLFEFSDRLDSALKEDKTLIDAVGLLTKKTTKV